MRERAVLIGDCGEEDTSRESLSNPRRDRTQRVAYPSGRSPRASLLLAALLVAVCATTCREGDGGASVVERPGLTLHIGLIPELNIFKQRSRYRPIAEYVSEKLGVDIQLRVLSRYGNIIDNFVSNRLDGAFFGSFTGALAQRKLGVEALVRPQYPDGTSTYHGLLFVRKDSGISDADDMRGKRFVFVDKATTAGWLLPLYYFKTHGVSDYKSWLKEYYFSGTHEGAIQDVLTGAADIGVAKSTVFTAMAAVDPRLEQALVILSRSPDVPENALCVRKSLERRLKVGLKESLLRMHEDPEGRRVLQGFGAARFIPTTEEDYAVVFEYARRVGLDLESYDYVND